ncbi:MAG: MFS transporter [Actinomycetota bacterium]
MDELGPQHSPGGSVTPSSLANRRGPSGVLVLLAGYAAFGMYWGVWVVIQLDFLRENHMSEGALGLLFSGLSVVSIATMTLLTPRIQQRPLAMTIAIGLITMAGGGALIAIGAGPILLAGFVVLGVGNGLIDVFSNIAAQGVEARERRPVLQWLHASYSVGGIVGAIGAGAAIEAGVSFTTVMLVEMLALVAAATWTITSPRLRRLPRPAAAQSGFSLGVLRRAPRLLLPALVIMFAFFVEGSMDVWSGTYVRKTLGSTAFVAGAAFAAFSLAIAVGRLTAGKLLFGLGYDRTILVSGAGAFVGGVIATLTSSPLVAAIGFLILGFFISAAAPAAFGLADRTDQDPASAVAGMSTVGYTGFVIGPPIMGLLAESSGLRLTMGVIAMSTLGVAACGILDRLRHGASVRT